MMIDVALRFLYGAIVVSSGFLIGSMGRLAAREWRTVGGHAALRSVYFWLAANLAVQAVALVAICGIRTFDAFHGVVAGAEWGWTLVAGFGMLLLTKVGFTWAGTLTFKHGKAIWLGYLMSIIGWTLFVAWWTVQHSA